MKSLLNKALVLALISSPMFAGSMVYPVTSVARTAGTPVVVSSERYESPVVGHRVSPVVARLRAAAEAREAIAQEVPDFYNELETLKLVSENSNQKYSYDDSADGLATARIQAKQRAINNKALTHVRVNAALAQGLTLKERLTASMINARNGIAQAWNFSKANPLQAAGRATAALGAAGALYAMNKYVLNPYVFTPVCNKVIKPAYNKVKGLFVAPVAKKAPVVPVVKKSTTSKRTVAKSKTRPAVRSQVKQPAKTQLRTPLKRGIAK